jgi:Uri superfamily endonuclease
MKGSYVLLIRLENPGRIRVGRLGLMGFRQGYYAYVGSALNSLEKRIGRHLSSSKRLHWHIDYLLEKAEVVEVFRIESPLKLECRIAERLASALETVKGFGCSDCGCASHLFYSGGRKALQKAVEEAITRCGTRCP